MAIVKQGAKCSLLLNYAKAVLVSGEAVAVWVTKDKALGCTELEKRSNFASGSKSALNIAFYAIRKTKR